MYVIRNVMHCKPGKVKAMVDQFKDMNAAMKSAGSKSTARILTDVAGARYWTAIIEIETDSVEKHEAEMNKIMADPNMQKKFAPYHELVDTGYREIFKIEN